MKDEIIIGKIGGGEAGWVIEMFSHSKEYVKDEYPDRICMTRTGDGYFEILAVLKKQKDEKENNDNT